MHEIFKNGILALIMGDKLEYPATQVFLKALRRLGIDIASLETSKINTSLVLQQVPRLCQRILKGRHANLIIVPYMSHRIVPAAWWISRRVHARLWFLPLISQYETAVYDRKTAKAKSIKAAKAFILDWYGCHFADLILFDTYEQLYYYKKHFGKIPKAAVVPIGVDDEIFMWNPIDKSKIVTSVLFYGGFSPLHGADVMVRAAALLPKEKFRFTFIGDGPEKSKCISLRDVLDVTNIRFLPNVPYVNLPRIIADHEIGLGVFGSVSKVNRVIPNKVLQTLSVGRPIITRNSDSLRTSFKGIKAIIMTHANASEIASAIQFLTENLFGKEDLYLEASRYTRRVFGIDAIAQNIRRLLEEDAGIMMV